MIAAKKIFAIIDRIFCNLNSQNCICYPKTWFRIYFLHSTLDMGRGLLCCGYFGKGVSEESPACGDGVCMAGDLLFLLEMTLMRAKTISS